MVFPVHFSGELWDFYSFLLKQWPVFPGACCYHCKRKTKNKHSTQEWKGDQVNNILFRSPKIGLQHLKSRHIKVGYFIASAIIPHNELCILLLQLLLSKIESTKWVSGWTEWKREIWLYRINHTSSTFMSTKTVSWCIFPFVRFNMPFYRIMLFFTSFAWISVFYVYQLQSRCCCCCYAI